MDASILGSSAHVIFQARILEWVAVASSYTKRLYLYSFFLRIIPESSLKALWWILAHSNNNNNKKKI